jgi:hypothetical protein
MTQKDVALYYYVKTSLKNLHKKCHFHIIFNPFMSPLSNEKKSQSFKMFLNIISSLDWFQIILHVFIIY